MKKFEEKKKIQNSNMAFVERSSLGLKGVTGPRKSGSAGAMKVGSGDP